MFFYHRPHDHFYMCLFIAVGQTIKVKKDGVTKDITCEKRPTACALCPCKSGQHAMHPLYDKSGPDGQPLLDKDDNLLWVHTLCAVFISGFEASSGAVYGCDERGRYESISSDEEESDSNDENVDQNQNGYNFKYDEDGEEVLTAAPHHFIISSKADNASKEILHFISECRSELKCAVCKNPDRHSRRLAVQVSLYSCS